MMRQLTYPSIVLLLITTWVSSQTSRSNYTQWENNDGLEAYQFHTTKLRGAFVADDGTMKVKGSGHGLRGQVFLPTGKDLHRVDKEPCKGHRRAGISNLHHIYSKTAPLSAH